MKAIPVAHHANLHDYVIKSDDDYMVEDNESNNFAQHVSRISWVLVLKQSNYLIYYFVNSYESFSWIW